MWSAATAKIAYSNDNENAYLGLCYVHNNMIVGVRRIPLASSHFDLRRTSPEDQSQRSDERQVLFRWRIYVMLHNRRNWRIAGLFGSMT